MSSTRAVTRSFDLVRAATFFVNRPYSLVMFDPGLPRASRASSAAWTWLRPFVISWITVFKLSTDFFVADDWAKRSGPRVKPTAKATIDSGALMGRSILQW